MHCTVIIPAAGIGSRFGGEVPKQYTLVGGLPILVRTIDRFLESGMAARIIVATSAEDRWWPEISATREWREVVRVEGGATRQESVTAALNEAGRTGLVAVHDAVRPYFRAETLKRLLEEADEIGAAIPALPLRETIHRVESDRIRETLDRTELRGAQTPQCFRAELLHEVMDRARADSVAATDEAALAARYGHAVRVVEGDVGNVKITTPDDLLLVEPFLKRGEP